MKKKLPTLKSDKDAENFIENSDLAEYDLSGAKQVRSEFQNWQVDAVNQGIEAAEDDRFVSHDKIRKKWELKRENSTNK